MSCKKVISLIEIIIDRHLKDKLVLYVHFNETQSPDEVVNQIISCDRSVSSVITFEHLIYCNLLEEEI